MICISNGILPDLGDLNEDKQPKKEETPLFEFSYDNTLEEIDGAMKSFQSRFKNRRHTLSVVAYAVIGAAVIFAIIMNPEQFFAYAALIFCLVGLFYSLTDKKRARAKTLEALRDMNPEDYKYYCDLRRYGSCRHAGYGLGFERMVMYLTGINNIRDVELHPRTVGNAEF